MVLVPDRDASYLSPAIIMEAWEQHSAQGKLVSCRWFVIADDPEIRGKLDLEEREILLTNIREAMPISALDNKFTLHEDPEHLPPIEEGPSFYCKRKVDLKSKSLATEDIDNLQEEINGPPRKKKK